MDMVKIREYRERVPLFHGIEDEDILRILSKGLTTRCAKGSPVFYKDTVGNQMYVILAGKMGVMEHGHCIASLGTGEMFGEMALVNKEPRSATIVALEDSHLFVLSESTFERLMTKKVAIRLLMNIIGTMSHRIKAANERLAQQ